MTNLQVATGAPYEIVKAATCCGTPGNGRFWLDWPYVLQSNETSPPDPPVFYIKTAIADTDATQNPLVTFSINKCATVRVMFGEKGLNAGCATPYPSWILSQGFVCSVTTCGGTVETFYHDTLGSADQVLGPACSKTFKAGPVQLGPREPQGAASAKMYSILIREPFDVKACPP